MGQGVETDRQSRRYADRGKLRLGASSYAVRGLRMFAQISRTVAHVLTGEITGMFQSVSKGYVTSITLAFVSSVDSPCISTVYT